MKEKAVTLSARERDRLVERLEADLANRTSLCEYLGGLSLPARIDLDEALAELLTAAATSDARLQALSDEQLRHLRADPAALFALAEEVAESYRPAWNAVLSPSGAAAAPPWEALQVRVAEEAPAAHPADFGQVAE